VLAVTTTAAYFLVVFGFPAIMRRIPASPHAPSGLHLRYVDGRGLLRHVIGVCTGRGFSVADIAVDRSDTQVTAGDVNEVFD
jgi:putative Mg2+ transporter-C (MgtC) family protein